MAKKASGKSADGAKPGKKQTAKKSRTQTLTRSRPERAERTSNATGDAVRKLLESPLVADLLAVGATAALAAIAEHGFGGGEGQRKGTSKAIKQAGKAAATAMGRRLGTEFDEIRKASKVKRGEGASA